MAEKIEKQRFYISEFEQEAAWLSFMQREGWKFESTDGWNYRFTSCEKEDWVYQLDFKEDGGAEEDYIQMYEDFEWEYVTKYQKWFYFRKKKEDANDLSIFSDRQSKIDMCKRVINGQFVHILPLYICMFIYEYLFLFTDIMKGDGFVNGLCLGIAIGVMGLVIFVFGCYLGQISRLNKMIADQGQADEA